MNTLHRRIEEVKSSWLECLSEDEKLRARRMLVTLKTLALEKTPISINSIKRKNPEEFPEKNYSAALRTVNFLEKWGLVKIVRGERRARNCSITLYGLYTVWQQGFIDSVQLLDALTLKSPIIQVLMRTMNTKRVPKEKLDKIVRDAIRFVELIGMLDPRLILSRLKKERKMLARGQERYSEYVIESLELTLIANLLDSLHPRQLTNLKQREVLRLKIKVKEILEELDIELRIARKQRRKMKRILKKLENLSN